MSEDENWVLSSDNHGRTRWAKAVAGLPSNKPKWQLLKCAKYGASWDFCLTDSRIFISSAELLAIALDIKTGEKIWETVFPTEASYDVAINNREVFISPYILDQEDGKIIEDLSSIDNISVVADIVDNVFYCHLIAPTEGLLRLDSKKEIFSFDSGLLMVHKDSGLIISRRDQYILASKWGNSKPIWKVTVPLAQDGDVMLPSSVFMYVGDMVYVHICKDTLIKIEVHSGNIIWQSGPDEIEENETSYQSKPPQRFLGCDDTLYLCREIDDTGYLQARSVEDGRELWCIHTPQARAFLIAGDLLFGALDDVPVAWDRHTGKIVWNADKKMTAIIHAAAAANKIIYTNTMSQMRCYEWTEPYHSPAK
ncbi:MAG: PQQ-binding-like beta-propeller repeat protein [Candidatus Thiodiazotropha weberae]|nr:PQQ-binding-like beta-propeller repeat protein [Candidatus Thiodiazotropha lotti]MCG8011748.1 PQQ-binding-like beta-propeller repeat protein [Candidatus Thiodiazotropha lotti]MCW4211214.1 PQQ-binding-like beta-propeller repeat protein [Candidatus Thiodiazotropha lotti]MCW4218085.1 PQQ-binding-like beta-propeller repeat protein [Candidatus Thiodiazotropha lotti]